MRKLLSLLLITTLFVPFVNAQPFPPVPFELLPSGHIVVKATVEGVTGNFIFDTGAGLTVFTKTFFDKLPARKAEDGGFTGFRATGERLDMELYKVAGFTMGSFKKGMEEVSFIEANFGGYDGILSLKLLEKQPFTIDYTKREIVFESPAQIKQLIKTGKVVPLQLEQSRGKALDIFAYFTLNDSLRLQCSLDGGAGKDVFKFNSRYMDRLGISRTDTTRVKIFENKSETNEKIRTRYYTATVDKIALSDAGSIRKIKFRAQFLDTLIYDGILSINWLGNRITIDLPGSQLIIRD